MLLQFIEEIIVFLLQEICSCD